MTDETAVTAEPTEAESEALWNEVNAALKGQAPQKPESQPAEDESSDAESDEQTEVSESDDGDIWANANDQQRQAFDALQKQYADLEHRHKSDGGRVSALQKQINDLTAKLEAASKPPREEGHDGIPNALKNFSESFPDEARALNAFLAEQTKGTAEKITQLEQTIEQLQQGSKSSFDATLDVFKPDWADVVKSNEFKQWFVVQDEATQRLYYSPKAGDAINLLKQFDAHAEGTKKKATALNDQRKQRLSNAQTVAAKSTGVDVDGQADDLDSLWQQAVKAAKA